VGGKSLDGIPHPRDELNLLVDVQQPVLQRQKMAVYTFDPGKTPATVQNAAI
jgi:hypothetical protein